MDLNRNYYISSLLLVFFLGLVVFLGLMGEFFQSQKREFDHARIYANPLVLSPFTQLKSISLENKQGLYSIENQHPRGDLVGPWVMTNFQNIKVKNEIINAILLALDGIKVRNFYKKEPINLQSFSIDKPNATLKLESTQNKKVTASLGLINPIDQSAYISFDTEDQIYQIEPLEIPIETWEISNLVDSKIFFFNISDILEIQTYKSNPSEPILHLLIQENLVTDKLKGEANFKKVSTWIDEINEIKTLKILNQLPTEILSSLRESFFKPENSFKIITRNSSKTYYLATHKGALPINLSPPYHLLSNEDMTQFYVIENISKNIFKKTYDQIKR